MIENFVLKVKQWLRDNQSDLYIAVIIFLVGMASFGLGRLSVLWPRKEPITVTSSQDTILENYATDSTTTSQKSPAGVSTFMGKYVASRSGKYYHFPWCPGALKIKEENKIWFQTKEEAESGGLKPAGNCPGL